MLSAQHDDDDDDDMNKTRHKKNNFRFLNLSSSSPLEHDDCMDSHDSPLPSVPINHHTWQVLYTASRDHTVLVKISFYWSADTSASMCKKEFIEEVSPAVPNISCSFYLDGLWGGISLLFRRDTFIVILGYSRNCLQTNDYHKIERVILNQSYDL